MTQTKTLLKRAGVLTICLLMLIFQRQVVWGINLIVMIMCGQTAYCPLLHSIDSYAQSRDKRQRTKEYHDRAKLIEKDPLGFELYEINSRRIWIPSGNLNSLSQCLAEQERGIYDYHGLGARPGDVVLDAGAHVGLYVHKALADGATKVIAIEPVPSNIECLRRNLKNEIAAGKVVVWETGVWDKDDILTMHVDPENAGGDSFVLQWRETTTSLRLPLTTVDRLAAELHLDKVDFIKMDIEGAERRALAGAATVIRKYRPRIAVCIYHLQDDPIMIPTLIRSIRHDYHQECGPCLLVGGKVRPQVYFYY